MSKKCPHPVFPNTSTNDLDSVLDRFDLAWQEGPPPAIEGFLTVGKVGPRRLLHELIKIDLEYRWRCPRSSGPKRSLPNRPRLEDYVKHVPSLEALEHLPLSLIAEEYRVRQRWGDRPGHAEYAARFTRLGTKLSAELARIDKELAKERDSIKWAACTDDNDLSRMGSISRKCPHCRQAIEVVPESRPLQSACPDCGDEIRREALSSRSERTAQPPLRRLGRYELGDLLGTGAFGSVWKARDTELGREVAVKLPRIGRFVSPAEEERFLREARFAAQLHHPGIVAVHDVGREKDTLYIVSELVRGVNLAEWMRGRRLSFLEAAALVAQVADALAYAHRQGVVHRDIKPSNILVDSDCDAAATSTPTGQGGQPMRRTRIVDFGLALGEAGEVRMTLDGQILGTPAYMSPEQVGNPHVVDGRSDMYSLGVILYELITGELPFRGTAQTVLQQVLADAPRPPRQFQDRIPRDLETICLTCLAKEPSRRYRTTGALAADLRRWSVGEPIQARPILRIERVWLWAKRNRTLPLSFCLATVTLLAVTGAPMVAVLTAIAIGALLFALHQAKVVAKSVDAHENLKQQLRKSLAAQQFAFKHYARAQAEQKRALAAETRASNRFTRLCELARTVLFELPEKIAEAPDAAPARALLIRTIVAYLDGLAKEACDDPLLLREAAVAYARLGDIQAGSNQRMSGDAANSLISFQKSLELFAALSVAHPDNVQAQRDLMGIRSKVERLQQTLDHFCPEVSPPKSGDAPVCSAMGNVREMRFSKRRGGDSNPR